MRALLLVLLLVTAFCQAQTTCALSGTVQDAGGALVPGAKITLIGRDNGFVRTVTTNRDGFFSYPDLTPATFTLVVEAAGFKLHRETGILVSSAEDRSLPPIKLAVGQLSESVTISAEAVGVNLSTGERSGTLSGEQLDQIALRGRDIFDAVSLMAGVVDTSDGRDAPGPTSIGNIYIMGGRNDSKNMTVDGVTNLDTGSNGSVHSMPSMDSIAEIKVLLSAYSAENGRNPSSINVITNGGGSSFHGGASWYFRNEDLNANDFFSNRAGRDRTPYRYNIAGYNIGGPVLLPHFSGLKSKLFFFFNQEYQQQLVQYGTKLITVPTLAERNGDFSNSHNTNGTLWTVNDPLNKKTLFPGRIIPKSRITPTGQAILNLFPLPNYQDPNPVNLYQYNYFVSSAGAYPRRTETARIDYSPRSNWQVYVSASDNGDKQDTLYGLWVDGSLNYPITPIVFQQPGKLATIHSTNSAGHEMFHDASFAVSQNTLTYGPRDPARLDRTQLGINIPQRNPALNPLNLIPDLSFGGIANAANPSLSDGTPYYNQNTIFSFNDNVSKVSGTHTYKAGLYWERTQKIQSASPLTRGSLAFGADGNNPLDSNNAYANALLGNFDTYGEATNRPTGNFRFTNTEFYFQDNWRVTRHLALDYGVRFYYDPPQYDVNGALASFSPALYNAANAPVLLRPALVNGVRVALDPVTGNTYPQGLVGAFAPGHGDPANGDIIGGKNGVPKGLYTTLPLDVAPRFGFAWDPFGKQKTAIRGGGGVYYDRIQGNPVMGQIGNPPSVFSPTQYYGTFADIAANAGSGLLAPSGNVTSLATPGHQQTVYNFNLNIQRQIGHSTAMEIGYAGALGRHQLWERNINPVPLGAQFLNLHPENRDPTATSNALPANFLRPYQGLGDVFLYEFANSSNYHSLQASFQRRMSHGLSLNASYTFSKALDAADAYNSTIDPFLSPRMRNYGPAGFDRRQVFNANFYYVMPKLPKSYGFKPAHWLLDSWEFAGVIRYNTGGPYTPSLNYQNGVTTASGSASETPRVQVLDPNAPLNLRFGPPPEPAGQNNVPWKSSSTAPQLGNLGKNTITGPGTANWDLSLYRGMKFNDRISGQLRIESYNAFNHTQFSTVDTALRFDPAGAMYNTAFNTPTAARPPRRIQLALRIRF